MKSFGLVVLWLVFAASAANADDPRGSVASIHAERLDQQASIDLARSLEQKAAQKLDRRTRVIFYDESSKVALTVRARLIRPLPAARPINASVPAAIHSTP